MDRHSRRLRRVLDIARSQRALTYLRQLDNDEARRWADYKREHNLPADADPTAGDWF